MQLETLSKLDKLRKNGENKGLVIAATGTGKTYLSAFDANAFNAKKLLFIVHNKEIATNAKKTFEKIFTDTRTYGYACDGDFEIDKDFIFALPETINNRLDCIDKDLFDYIKKSGVSGGNASLDFKDAKKLYKEYTASMC